MPTRIEQVASALVAESGATHDGVGVLGEELGQADGGSGLGSDALDQRGGFLLPDAAEGPAGCGAR